MNISIKPKKKKYILYAAVIALFASVCSSLALVPVNEYTILEQLRHKTRLNYFFALLRMSLKEGNEQVICQIVGVSVFILFLVLFSYQFSKREIISSAVMGSLFGICMWIGAVYSKGESWNFAFVNKYMIMLDILYIAGYAVIMFGSFLAIIKLINWYENKKEQERMKNIAKLKEVFLVSVVVVFVCWLPYYIIFWPGIQNADFQMQSLQLFHLPIRFQGGWVTDGKEILYSNDHPFIHTQIVGLFIKLGLKIHNLALGYGIYVFLQMSAYIIIISIAIVTLYYFNVKIVLLKIALIFYAVCPVFPAYAILIGGDSFFVLFFMCFMIVILWVFGTEGAILKRKSFVIASIVIVFMLAAAKNQGIYITVIFATVLLGYCKKYRIQAAITMLVPIFFFQFAYTGIIFQMAHVGKVGTQEALSICFQQTARYVKYHKEEVTKNEREVIDRVLKYDIIAKKYNPNIADPVKSKYRRESSSDDLKNYFKVWALMGVKHPGEYIQSFMASTYGYYYPILKNKDDSRGIYLKTVTIKNWVNMRQSWAKKTIPESVVKKLSFQSPKVLKPVREATRQYVLLVRNVPIVSWFFSPGAISWMMFSAFFVLWIKRKYKTMILFLPAFLIFCVCLLSPVNNNLRYIYPVCSILPVMLACAFGDFYENRKKSEKIKTV